MNKDEAEEIEFNSIIADDNKIINLIKSNKLKRKKNKYIGIAFFVMIVILEILFKSDSDDSWFYIFIVGFTLLLIIDNKINSDIKLLLAVQHLKKEN